MTIHGRQGTPAFQEYWHGDLPPLPSVAPPPIPHSSDEDEEKSDEPLHSSSHQVKKSFSLRLQHSDLSTIPDTDEPVLKVPPILNPTFRMLCGRFLHLFNSKWITKSRLVTTDQA
ncbi:MAG: hypothetical protein WB791_11280, partial [Waddliaceae bacterium]